MFFRKIALLKRLPYLFQFFRMFIVVLAVIVPIFQSLGLTMAQVFQTQAIFGITIVALEIPTGYLADRWGRKRTLVLGSFLYGTSYFWLLFCRGFVDLVIYEIVIGLGFSLLSGTDISFVYDAEIDPESSAHERAAGGKRVLANLQMYQAMGEGLAAVAGGWLAVTGLTRVLQIQAVVGWMPFVIALMLRDRPMTDAAKKKVTLSEVHRVGRMIFSSAGSLRLILANLVIWGLSSFFVVWTLQRYWQERGIGLQTFGWLWAASNILVGVAGKQVSWLAPVLKARGTLLLIGFLPLCGFFGMGMLGGLAGVACGFLFCISRGFNQVYLKEAFNREIPSELRATANSMQTFLFRLVFAIGGPAFGHLVDRRGSEYALIVLGIIFTAAFVFVLLPLVKRAEVLTAKA